MPDDLPPPPRTSASSPLPAAPYTALIVDDDEDCRIIYGAALANEGFDVHVAANGAEGLACARELHPQVVLLDVAMPVLDGAAVARALKADEQTRAIPVIGITAEYSRYNRDELTVAGFDAVLLKPIDPATLVVAARQAVHVP